MEKRAWIELKCPRCEKQWEIMAADSQGLSAVDAEQRECADCRIKGVRTGAVIK